MDPQNDSSDGQAAWKGDKAPCIYCGQIVSRTEERCPHCRTSFSLAVRQAAREIVGPWYYLDSRNPSGRGVTFETLIKMIEKGRIRADSIVRGPTTHQDWLYAAEAPRLAKYLGMCPHCFAEVKPEDTFCTRCQLNMNMRPGEPRPGIPPDLVREPFHKAANEMEKQLAGTASPVEAAAMASEKADTPRPAPVLTGPGLAARTESIASAAAAAMADSSPAAAERIGRPVPAAHRRKPRLWLVLVLTWITLIPLALFIYIANVPSWFGATDWKTNLQARFGGPSTDGGTSHAGDEWLNSQLKEVDRAVAAREYNRALAVYDAIIAKTGDASWQARKEALLKQKAEEERRDRLAKLKERLQMADGLAADKKYDDALAVLRNIGSEDRTWLASLGVGVDKMEKSLKDQQAQAAKQKRQEEQLAGDLARAVQLRGAKNLSEALKVYRHIAATYPADIVQKQVNLDQAIQDIQTEIAAAKARATPTPEAPKPPVSSGMTTEEAAAAIADLMSQAAAAEKAEKFGPAVTILEGIKQKFEQKYWPDSLDERIRQDKAKEEALKFFGMDSSKKPAK
jgi:hypothetical protein